MLAYGEPNADANFKRIQKIAPHAMRVDNVAGILQAHKAAARLATTDNFYVVDADAVLVDHFDFSFTPDVIRDAYPGVQEASCIYLWQSVNSVNGLIYGYGGVKLFPRRALLNATEFTVDMTTTLDAPLVVKPQISNISEFNTDQFNTWRSAFRECVKLASSIIDYNINLDDKYRLDTWCSRGNDEPFGEYAMMGARQGREFGIFYKGDTVALDKVNDFQWLQKVFIEATR